MNNIYAFGLVITMVIVKQFFISIIPKDAQSMHPNVKEQTSVLCKGNLNPPGSSKPKGSSGAGSRRMSTDVDINEPNFIS